VHNRAHGTDSLHMPFFWRILARACHLSASSNPFARCRTIHSTKIKGASLCCRQALPYLAKPRRSYMPAVPDIEPAVVLDIPTSTRRTPKDAVPPAEATPGNGSSMVSNPTKKTSGGKAQGAARSGGQGSGKGQGGGRGGGGPSIASAARTGSSSSAVSQGQLVSAALRRSPLPLVDIGINLAHDSFNKVCVGCGRMEVGVSPKTFLLLLLHYPSSVSFKDWSLTFALRKAGCAYATLCQHVSMFVRRQ
jgi:hypothetical protein